MPDITPDIVSVKVGAYRVQMQSLGGQPDHWMGVVMPDLNEPDRTVPAVFTDVTDAEMFLNDMRNKNPRTVYRMIRDLTITEVVHA